MMKQFKNLAMTLALLMTAATGAWADGSGSCGNGLTWSETDGVLTISFTSGTTGDDAGKMEDYSMENIAPWGKDITKVIIEEGVTSIGGNAFSGCSGLTAVTIGSSVTTIGEFAFGNCRKLTDVTIPSSVTSIGDGTFEGCSNLTDVTIPSSVTSIGESAFSGCSNLTDVTIPSSVTSIGDFTFYGCTSLTTVIVEAESAALGGTEVFMYWDEDKSSNELLPNLTIYVPDGKVDAYKATEKWSTYKDIIQPNLFFTPDADGKVWTLAEMPAYNVVLEVEYYPVATIATAPAVQTETIYMGTETTLVTAGTCEGGTMMYLVSTTAPTSTDGFSETVPTAENITEAGSYNVYYYIKGDDTHSDSEISSVAATVLPDKYNITFDAANDNTIEAGKATVTVAGTAATPTDGKLSAVKMGSEVKIKAKTGYKFKSVSGKEKKTEDN